MSIRKRQTKRGASYDVCIYVAPGKRRAKTVHTKSAAIALEAAWIAERDAKSTHSGTLTLNQYIAKVYWPIASQRLSATSKDTYEQEIRLRINPALGALPLRDIDRGAIQNLMVDKCKSAGTAKKSIGVLKTILNEAIHDGYITKNYACSKFALPSSVHWPTSRIAPRRTLRPRLVMLRPRRSNAHDQRSTHKGKPVTWWRAGQDHENSQQQAHDTDTPATSRAATVHA